MTAVFFSELGIVEEASPTWLVTYHSPLVTEINGANDWT